jgi:hypothetical protein
MARINIWWCLWAIAALHNKEYMHKINTRQYINKYATQANPRPFLIGQKISFELEFTGKL